MARKKLERFLDFVEEVCPWFPEEGTVNLETWAKVGERLQDYYSVHGPKKVPVDTFSLWNLIRDCIDPRHEGNRWEPEPKLRQRSPSCPSLGGQKNGEPVSAPCAPPLLEPEKKLDLPPPPSPPPAENPYVKKPENDPLIAFQQEDHDYDDPFDLPKEDQEALEEAAAHYHDDDDEWLVLSTRGSLKEEQGSGDRDRKLEEEMRKLQEAIAALTGKVEQQTVSRKVITPVHSRASSRVTLHGTATPPPAKTPVIDVVQETPEPRALTIPSLPNQDPPWGPTNLRVDSRPQEAARSPLQLTLQKSSGKRGRHRGGSIIPHNGER